jgi:hypothetical protein
MDGNYFWARNPRVLWGNGKRRLDQLSPAERAARAEFKLKKIAQERDEAIRKMEFRASGFDELRAAEARIDAMAAQIIDLEEQLAAAKKPRLRGGTRVLTRIQRRIDRPETLAAADEELAGDMAAGYEIINVNQWVDGEGIHRTLMLRRVVDAKRERVTREVQTGLSAVSGDDPLVARSRSIVRQDGRFTAPLPRFEDALRSRQYTADELSLIGNTELMGDDGPGAA